MAAVALLAVAGAMALLLDSPRTASPDAVALFVAVYAAATRVRFYLGAGYTMPTQLVLVPMLFSLPVGACPLVVALGLAAGRVWDVAQGRAHPERVLTGTGDGWHAVGAAAALAVAGEPGPSAGAIPALAAALAAQCVVDVIASSAREWAGRGIHPSLQIKVMASVYAVDALLTPIGMLAVVATDGHALAALLVLPLIVLLNVFASDRRARIDEAVAQVDELARERARLASTIRRVGAAFASRLEREALLDLVIATTVDAVQADWGRATLIAEGEHTAAESTVGTAPAGFEDVLPDAERRAMTEGQFNGLIQGRARALAQRLGGTDDAPPIGVLSVTRLDRPFSEQDRELFAYLAGQMAVSVENVDLHEKLRQQVTTDGLTGLSNHRRLQEVIDREIERSDRLDTPLSVAMIDIDDFKQINDTHGHQQGDAVLREVARAIGARCRRIDEPARYGGEEFLVVLPNTPLAGGHAAAEGIRRAIEALSIPLPPGDTLTVTASLGVAALGGANRDKESLIAAADAALYEAKRTGKNRTVLAGNAQRRGRFEPTPPLPQAPAGAVRPEQSVRPR